MALNTQEGLFVQKVEHNDEEIDLSFLQRLSLVETLDLSGPKLIMQVRDPESILRDNMGVKPGSVLTVTFADYWNGDGDELVDRFTVLTMPDESEIVTLNCMQTDIWGLKSPAAAGRMFVRKPVETILRAMLPSAKVSVDRFAAQNDYHLLPGERPSKMLRQMDREIGAQVYYQRQTIYARRLSGMLAVDDPDFTFSYNNIQAEYPIIHYQRPNANVLIEDSIGRRYCGWDMVNGQLLADNRPAAGAEWTAATSTAVLNNLSVMAVPEIDILVPGMGALRPGQVLDLEWNLDRRDTPIDESLPARIIIGTTAHYYQAQKYLVWIKGVLPL